MAEQGSEERTRVNVPISKGTNSLRKPPGEEEVEALNFSSGEVFKSQEGQARKNRLLDQEDLRVSHV